jgi:hypothetical protein
MIFARIYGIIPEISSGSKASPSNETGEIRFGNGCGSGRGGASHKKSHFRYRRVKFLEKDTICGMQYTKPSRVDVFILRSRHAYQS